MLVALIIGLATAALAYLFIAQSGRWWRAVIAYLGSFLIGFILSVLWTAAVESQTHQIGGIFPMGFVGSLFGPWVGIGSAKVRRAKRMIR